MTTNATEAVNARNHIRRLGIPLFGESPAFLSLLRSIERIATHARATVLIRGETGTGKDLVARAIHYMGPRQDFPFVPVNCGALPETLAENEFFGHRPGAFTGATHNSTGLMRLANRGTLFLDELDSLPAKAQVALLRFLQDGTFRPLGSTQEECADVRIVAASNRCLEEEVRAGRLREDLYFRLNLVNIDVPPLRARQGDVHVLSRHFLEQCADRYQLPAKSIAPCTAAWFDQYGWPGNIRELENLIHREYLLHDGTELRIQPSGAAGQQRRATPRAVDIAAEASSYRAAKMRALQEFDRAYLTQLMHRSQGNVTRAAELAGKERRALGKLLKRYAITAGTHSGDQAD